MIDTLPGFVLAGLALAGSPGPATLSLAATGAAFGPRSGLAYMAGILAGMVAVMIMSGTGIVALLLALPGATPAVTALAAGYFLYLAWRIATAPPLSAVPRDSPGSGPRPGFADGLFLSLANPKGYAAMAALFSGFVLVTGRPVADLAVKCAVLILIIAAVNAAWLLAGVALAGLARHPATGRAINLAFAVLLLLSVAATFLL
ncbi:MAG: LysE family translocator [Sneathiellaceae bacterium]